jgi:hypothetical protein
LISLFTLVARERTGERVQNEVLAVLAAALGQIVVVQPRREIG